MHCMHTANSLSIIFILFETKIIVLLKKKKIESLGAIVALHYELHELIFKVNLREF